MSTPFQYHIEDEGLFALPHVMEVTCDEETCALWCMEVGLIDRSKLCPLCGANMKPSFVRKRWKCSRRAEHAEGKEVSRGMLTSSFLNESKLKLHRAARLLLAWCMRLSQVQASEMADVCERTVRDWYAYCRSTCSKELLKAEFKVLLSCALSLNVAIMLR
ncbi:hypothetical protein PHYSODRAFT_248293 [Phytophthora sojae]|uniref:Uncharacterized protein n=1 Tax=Phytophthora sojae (strain P6497) TaxID=1094619 RepID=G4YGK0_PHYSP|nr:hypothetical protein PHYSODRAFT_248293 [Phytophthora sojae]EGZ26535.1 hypothetical protein PHYSODRAFT_248293 [Phytophthora sojae]|eukprot:XP_009513810.1 hypothetical protein PHYSODRAFT_248293 [Phytophthora sojae]